MSTKNLLTAIIALAIATNLSAQTDWKTLKKKADEYYAKGDYPRAGDAYMAAYKDKSKQEFAEKAAECFTISREYAALAAALEPLRNEKVERAGFKYANALKQAGRYTDAIREFQLYINNHKGKDYDKEEKRVQMLIEGCHLGLKLQKETPTVGAPARIAKICTDQTDYAPTLVEDRLYYASVSNGLSTIFTAEKSGAGFAKPTPLAFTKAANTHYGHPTITPDGNRMYFTVCTNAKGAKPICQIYGMEQKNGKWSDPVKLPDFINLKDATTTQPFVAVMDKKEYLYFVSDRKGGQGGADIWVATRNTESEGYAFTLPINLGANVNTPYEEVTPRFVNNTLYFSSDGFVGVGGLDVFSTQKKGSTWSEPKNLGMPINTAADDTYYTPADKTFFMVSNRIVNGEKTSSADDDIFTSGTTIVENTSGKINLSGKIIDAATRKGLSGVMFSLIDDISGKEIETKTCNENFAVSVFPAMKFRLEARKDGFKTTSLAYRSPDDMNDVVQNIEMTRLADYKGNTSKIGEPEPIEQVSDKNDDKMVDKAEPKLDAEPDIKLDEPEKTPINTDNIESTVFYGDLSPEEKSRIITIGGKKVLPEPSGNKIVSMEPLGVASEPKSTDKPTDKVADKPVVKTDKPADKAVVKTDKASDKPIAKTDKPADKPADKATDKPKSLIKNTNKTTPTPKPADDEDASNDADGAAIGGGDTKEGTTSKPNPAPVAKAGTIYKVQLASLGANEKFVSSKYDYAAKLGATIETEPGPNGVGTRVVASPTAGSADAFMKKLAAAGKPGFKVKYTNGTRIN
jgi:WD40-like Beta Propeller Repeat